MSLVIVALTDSPRPGAALRLAETRSGLLGSAPSLAHICCLPNVSAQRRPLAGVRCSRRLGRRDSRFCRDRIHDVCFHRTDARLANEVQVGHADAFASACVELLERTSIA